MAGELIKGTRHLWHMAKKDALWDIMNNSRFRIGEVYVDGPHPVTVGDGINVPQITQDYPEAHKDALRIKGYLISQRKS